METPIHTHKTNYYKILRPCLWFAKDDVIETNKFREYFTGKAIKSLQDFGFIKLIFNG
jgi:hypothetical protein